MHDTPKRVFSLMNVLSLRHDMMMTRYKEQNMTQLLSNQKRLATPHAKYNFVACP